MECIRRTPWFFEEQLLKSRRLTTAAAEVSRRVQFAGGQFEIPYRQGVAV